MWRDKLSSILEKQESLTLNNLEKLATVDCVYGYKHWFDHVKLHQFLCFKQKRSNNKTRY